MTAVTAKQIGKKLSSTMQCGVCGTTLRSIVRRIAHTHGIGNENVALEDRFITYIVHKTTPLWTCKQVAQLSIYPVIVAVSLECGRLTHV